MEHQDLLNALKGKRLYWRDEDNEYDGVIEYIAHESAKAFRIYYDEGLNYIILSKYLVEELATEGHYSDGCYTYCLEEPPIESIRKALVGKVFGWSDETGDFKGKICKVKESKYKQYKGVLIYLDNDDDFALDYPTVNELIAKGEASDDCYTYTLLSDETTATATAGDISYSDGIDWEARTWQVAKALYLRSGGIDVVGTAKTFVERYRKEMEDKV